MKSVTEYTRDSYIKLYLRTLFNLSSLTVTSGTVSGSSSFFVVALVLL